MVASIEEVRYKGSIDCFRQMVSKEGSKALMKGFGTNIFTGVFGTVVLIGYNSYLQPFFKIRASISD